MKILFLVPYFHSDKLEPYKRFSAGLAYTVASIINHISKKGHDVSVYAQTAFSKGYEEDNIHYMPKKIIHIFPLPFYYIKQFFKDTKGQHMGIKHRLRTLAHYLYGGYAERLLNKIKPDIVSIRGVGYVTRSLVLACERTNTKYVLSLHGLIQFLEGDGCLNTAREKEMEREAFLNAVNKGQTMTVIGSGIRTRMLQSLNVEDPDHHIRVVNNGIETVNFSADPEAVQALREKYNIAENEKIMISAAHLMERKNQIQIIRAFALMPEEEQKNAKLLILGDGVMREKLKEEIIRFDLSDKIIMCGTVPNTEMKNYFAIAHMNVISSLDEGFGRAFAEAYLAGVPSVTFADLDAVPDLYHEKAMVKVEERSDEALAEGILKALHTNWDKEFIKSHGENFSAVNMASNYEKIYMEVIKK